MLLMSHIDLEGLSRERVWFLDSGYNNHMSGENNWFSELDHIFRQSVKVNNNSILNVMGKGNIRMKIEEKIMVFTEVFYILDLKNNLISIGQLQEVNLAIVIQHECYITYHDEKGLLMQTTMTANRMFVLLASAPTNASGMT